MLRKRSRPMDKDQTLGHLMLDHLSIRNGSFFGVSGRFLGFTVKGLSDHDSAKSPTSPLDHKVFSNPSRVEGKAIKSRDFASSSKVGLGIVDSLGDESNSNGELLVSPEGSSILVVPRMRINIPSLFKPRSLPESCGISPLKSPNIRSGSSEFPLGLNETNLESEMDGKFRSCCLYSDGSNCDNLSESDGFWPDTENTPKPEGMESCEIFCDLRSGSLEGSGNEFIGCLSASEIEHSEDYTRVISHGPNLTITHIYGDSILESHTFEQADFNKKEDGKTNPPSSDDFLSFCYSCRKKLGEGEDIYMYRGEKAFCSSSCREHEIICEDEFDKAAISVFHSTKPAGEELEDGIFSSGMAISS